MRYCWNIWILTCSVSGRVFSSHWSHILMCSPVLCHTLNSYVPHCEVTSCFFLHVKSSFPAFSPAHNWIFILWIVLVLCFPHVFCVPTRAVDMRMMFIGALSIKHMLSLNTSLQYLHFTLNYSCIHIYEKHATVSFLSFISSMIHLWRNLDTSPVMFLEVIRGFGA